MKLLLSNDPKLNQRVNLKTVSAIILVEPEKYGIDQTWYGGNLRQIGEIVGSPLLLMINMRFETLGVGVLEENIPQLTPEECKAFNVAYTEPKIAEDTPKTEVKITRNRQPGVKK